MKNILLFLLLALAGCSNDNEIIQEPQSLCSKEMYIVGVETNNNGTFIYLSTTNKPNPIDNIKINVTNVNPKPRLGQLFCVDGFEEIKY